MGFGWSMLGPLLNYTVVGLIFSHVSRFRSENYVPYLMVGSAVFSFISMSFNAGLTSIIMNESYIKKIYLPKLIFPLNSVCTEVVNFALQMMALCVVIPVFGRLPFSFSLIFVPIGIALVFLFMLGCATLLSVMAVFFRDLAHVVPILLQILFFATPIVYPLEQAPSLIQKLSPINPIFVFVDIIRTPICAGHFAPLTEILTAIVYALIAMTLGFAVLKLNDNKIVFKL